MSSSVEVSINRLKAGKQSAKSSTPDFAIAFTLAPIRPAHLKPLCANLTSACGSWAKANGKIESSDLIKNAAACFFWRLRGLLNSRAVDGPISASADMRLEVVRPRHSGELLVKDILGDPSGHMKRRLQDPALGRVNEPRGKTLL